MRSFVYWTLALTAPCFASMITEAKALSQALLSFESAVLEERPSFWLHVDLASVESDSLNEPSVWESVSAIGMDAVYLQGLKEERKSKIAADPKWNKTLGYIHKKGFCLIADAFHGSNLGEDFQRALKADPDYTGLYKLIEVAEADWQILPKVSQAAFLPLSWLESQELSRAGYIASSDVKRNHWSASGKVTGVDGKARRWIYQKAGFIDPAIDWESPTFAAHRIACADMLDSSAHLGVRLFHIDSEALSHLASKVKKIGALSIEKSPKEFSTKADFTYDIWTKELLELAYKKEDATLLKQLYSRLLQEKMPLSSLVHKLECSELSMQRFMSCFYGLQPGSLCIKAQALVGALPEAFISLSKPNEEAVYAGIESQLSNSKSYVRYLRSLSDARATYSIAKSDLLDVLETPAPIFAALFQLPKSADKMVLIANFSASPLTHTIHSDHLRKTSALDLLEKLLVGKAIDSASLTLDLEPKSVQAIWLKSRAYD